MSSNALLASFLIGLFVALALGVPGEASGAEYRRGYIGGGSFSGTIRQCLPAETAHDLLAACNIPCPGGTCDIKVIDDVRGSNIGFRVCFHGETFCRPNRYWGEAHVEGTMVTIVPILEHATRGVVIVT